MREYCKGTGPQLLNHKDLVSGSTPRHQDISRLPTNRSSVREQKYPCRRGDQHALEPVMGRCEDASCTRSLSKRQAKRHSWVESYPASEYRAWGGLGLGNRVVTNAGIYEGYTNTTMPLGRAASFGSCLAVLICFARLMLLTALLCRIFLLFLACLLHYHP